MVSHELLSVGDASLFSLPCVRHRACYHGLVKVGVIGLGFMGATHLNAFKAIEGVEIAAVASSNPKALEGDLRGTGGNLGRGTENHCNRLVYGALIPTVPAIAARLA